MAGHFLDRKQSIDRLREAGHEPVAIIGAACRLPGAANVTEFWHLLLDERDTVTEIPASRFDVDEWYDPVPGTPRRITSRAGGFLDDVDRFDASFFGVSPREAVRLEPQQRLLLENVCEAVDDAGIPAEQLAGTNTGVYTSCFGQDYWDILRAAGMYDMHAAMGSCAWGMIAGRIAYHFDLRGPTMGTEAACGTSLLSLHLACRALRHGEIDMAIVGGVNLLLTPDLYFPLSEAEVLSPSGRCRFGDASADGYVRSEGVASLVLKPLSRAVSDGDRVLATILGSASTNNGRTGDSMITPGRAGQAGMLRTAYRDAGVSPGDIDYVEAHGTGTPNGDSTEFGALRDVLADGRSDGNRCLVGSVKSNVGHTEFAAGLVGVLKVALALRHRTVPATLHVHRRNPALDGQDMPIELATSTRPWPCRGRPGLAGVSGFGLSGAGTHVVLGEAPSVAKERPDPVARPAYLLTLSAHGREALRATAGRYAELLSRQVASVSPADVCFSAGAHRTHHGHRVAVVGADRKELLTALRGFANGTGTPSVGVARLLGVEQPHVVFVFPGQGSQWTGMGRELLRHSPAFAERMRECDDAIRHERGWSVIERLSSDLPLRGVSEIQPALWAMQVSLTGAWCDFGIEPNLVIGHSMGEIAAATASGALTVAEGAAVACRRSVLLANMRMSGAMWAIQLDEHAAREAIGKHVGRVSVGVINGENSTVLSGDPVALVEVLEPLRKRGVFCRQVDVDYASHAPQVEPLRAHLLRALADLRPRAGRHPIHSTVLDDPIGGEEMNAAYWMANLREPVRFASAIRSVLANRPDSLFVEISPHPLLLSAIEDTIHTLGAPASAVPSLHRGAPEYTSLLTSLGATYLRGCRPDWRRLYPDGRFVPLPGYPWQHRSFWAARETTAGPDVTAAGGSARTGPPPRTEAGLTDYLTRTIVEILGLQVTDVDPRVPLPLLGLDSLLAARLRARIRAELDLAIPVKDLLGTHTLIEVARRLSRSAPATRSSDVALIGQD